MNEKIYKILEFTQIRDELARRTSCQIAREMAEGLVPYVNKYEIEEKLRDTDDAVALIMKRGRPPLSGIANIIPSVKRAASGSAMGFGELLAVAGVLRAARRTLNYCGEDDEGNQIAVKISRLTENYRLESEISGAILSEDEMADDASPTLADIRRKIVSEQQSIKERLNEYIHSQKYQKAIQDGVITMRGDRYCIPVKAEYKGEFPGMVHDMSGSGQTLFIEPAAVVESNNKIRELRVREKQEIERIVLVLSSLCAQNSGILIEDVKLLSEIDFDFAKASLALSQKAQRPQINSEGKIKIVKGRHPLIDPHKVVPTSLNIGYNFRTLVITGPNTGGKTVTLKTVGLFTLMMQSGLLVPCESTSELAIFSNIFADIGDEQSIAQSLSTFSAHMKNIVEIVGKVDSHSLVLFDELGAGTDPTEGAALAMSILECVYQCGAITLATTHYSELKAFTVQTEGFENACCEFDVETLSPTYRLIIGIPGKSNAFEISKKLGLEENIVLRAKEFLTGESLRFEDMLNDIEKKRGEIEKSSQEIKRLTEESDRIKGEIDKEKSEIADKKAEIVRKAKEEAAKIIADARKTSDGMLSELRTLCRDAEANNRDKLRAGEAIGRDFARLEDENAVNLGDNPAAKKRAAGEIPEGEILPGECFYCVSLDSEVTVLKKENKNGEIQVSAGFLKLFVKRDDLRNVEKKAEEEQKTLSAAERRAKGRELDAQNKKFLGMKPEIDVRGEYGADAISDVDKFLDEAKLGRLETVTIIHGKGTGSLRQQIHEMLKKDKRVESFRVGEYGEGDYGVTVVKLK